MIELVAILLKISVWVVVAPTWYILKLLIWIIIGGNKHGEFKENRQA